MAERLPFEDGFGGRLLGYGIAIALVGALAGATVAILVTGWPGFGSDAASGSATPELAASARASGPPTDGGTAGVAGVVGEFDSMPIDGAVDGWALTGDAALAVAPLPSAVDRSLRLSAETLGTACTPANPRIGSLTAEFMVDALPEDPLPILALELADGAAIGIAIDAGGARLTTSSSPTSLEPGTWYRWSVTSSASDGLHVTLGTLDEPAMAEAYMRTSIDGASRFCLTAAGQTRVHLDSLLLEAE